MQNLKVLIFQTDLFWEDSQRNRENIEQKIISEFNAHDLILLPETFTTGFSVDPDRLSETIDGITVTWMKRLSQKLNTTIAGSLLIENNGKYANSFVWSMPDGSHHTYEKRHVFSMGGEHKKIAQGTTKTIVAVKGWKILPQICYDLRFPVWSRNSYKNNEFAYDLLVYTANWPAVRNHPWKTLLVGRAIENQAYAIGVNRVGTDDTGKDYSGDSMVVNAKGEIIAQGKEFLEEAITVILSKQELTDFRNSFNVGNDWDNFIMQ